MAADRSLPFRFNPMRTLVMCLVWNGLPRSAKRLASQLSKAVSGVAVSILSGFSQMGSGSLPTQNLPTTLVALRSEKISVDTLAKQLRQYRTPIFARIQNDLVLIDPRTLLSGDDKTILEALLEILGRRD